MNFPEKREEYLSREYESSKRIKISKYIGVAFDKKKNRYRVVIRHNKKDVRVCYLPNEFECAHKYDEYVVKHNIPGKKLNFPENHPNYNKDSIIKTECIPIDENTIRLLINNKEEIVTIDKEDYEKVKNYAWHIYEDYVQTKIGNETIKLHRFLMNATDPNDFIDHIDSNTYDNTKKNLRHSNVQKNGQNKQKQVNKSSKFYGICFGQYRQKWISKVAQKYIGADTNEIHAARRRDIYILEKLPNSHYKMNFEWTSQDIVQWKNTLNIQ